MVSCQSVKHGKPDCDLHSDVSGTSSSRPASVRACRTRHLTCALLDLTLRNSAMLLPKLFSSFSYPCGKHDKGPRRERRVCVCVKGWDAS